MLNTVTLNIGDCTNKVSFNTPSTGIIQKSNPKSNFIRFHSKSELAEYVFSDYPRLFFLGHTLALMKILLLGKRFPRK